MKKVIFFLAFILTRVAIGTAHPAATDSTFKGKKGDPARAKFISDSMKVVKLNAFAQYPLIKGSIWSGVLPVENPADVPDPSRDYKLVFKVAAKNPDSISKEISRSMDEVARILNLHVAAGIPAGKLFPVIVIQGAGLEAVMNSDAFRKSHSFDNPNLKVIGDLEKAGTKFIACGQSMAFQEVKKEGLLPVVKVALSAKTALSSYELQGYVLYNIEPDK